MPEITIDPAKVVTNIVIFDVSGAALSPNQICAALQQRGVLASGFGSAIRMVTHYDVSAADIETTLLRTQEVIAG